MTPWNYNWWNILEINSRIRYVCKREMGFFTFLFGKRKPKWKSITRDYLFIATCEIMWSWWRNKIPIPAIGQVLFYPDPDWAQCNRPHLGAVSRHPGTPVPNSDKNLERVKSGIYLLNILVIFNRKVSIWSRSCHLFSSLGFVHLEQIMFAIMMIQKWANWFNILGN